MTKKLISLLLCIVMAATVFVATVSAAGGETNVSFTVTKDTVNVGDEVVVVLSNVDMTVSSFVCGFYFDAEKFECTSIVGSDSEYPEDFGIIKADKRGTWVPATAISTVGEANGAGTIGFAIAGTQDATYKAGVVLTATFVAKAEGTANFVLYEDTAGTDVFKSDSIETKSVTIQVPQIPATGVALDTATLALKSGENKALVATVAPAECTNKALTWKSSDEAVATVVDGTVTAIKEGTATITVTTVDGGFTAECVVTVTCAHATLDTVEAKASDCKTQGWDEHKKCAACGKLFAVDGSEIAEIPFRPLSNEHVGGSKTCTLLPVCTVCGQPYGELAPHSYTDAAKKEEAIVTKGTCKLEAVYYYSCAACGKVEADPEHTFRGEKDALNHVGGTEVVGKFDADHVTQTPGYTGDTKCLDCGEIIEYGTAVQPTPHVPGEYIDVEANTAHVQLCALCSEPITSPEAHTSTGDNVATCLKAAVCDVCGLTYGEKLDHNYVDYDVKTPEGHAKACTYGCGTTTTVEAHVDDANAESCTVCGYIYHTCGVEMTENQQPASCDTAGWKTYYICSCNKLYADADAKNEITDLDAWKAGEGKIPAACKYVTVSGYAATCTEDGLTDYVYCSVCGKIETVATVIPATGHDWSAWTTVKVEGETRYQERECACGEKQENVIAPEHKCKLIHVEAVAPTCEENGNIEYWYCDECGWMETIGGVATNRLAVILPAAHTLVHVEAKAATCEEQGNIEYWYCTACDWMETVGGVATNRLAVILVVDHDLVHVEAVAATCETNGNIEYWYCKNCAWMETIGGVATNKLSVITPAAHNLVHVEAVAATCETNGNIEYWYCTACDWMETIGGVATNKLAVITPAAHNLEHVEAVAATCETNGNIEYWYCTACDWMETIGGVATNRLAVITPAAHNLEHVEAKAPTCEADGNIEYWYCTACDWMETIGGVATNRLSVILPAGHNLVHVEAKAPTCLELGNIEYWYCTNCDWMETVGGVATNAKAVNLPALDHTIEHVAAVAATCETEGNVEYWYCTVCGYAWLDEARTLVTNLQSVKTPAAHDLVHVEAKAATCFEMGNIEYWYCTKCAWMETVGGVATNKLAVQLPIVHNVEHVAAVAPTATENGNIEYWYCKDCGYAWLDELCTKNTNLKAVILPATGEPSAPDTGDNAIFFAVALVAVATVGTAVIAFKKKREN